MALTLDYSKRDAVALEEEAKAYITSIRPDWTDFLESDMGWAIVRTMIAITDHAMFQLDRQAAETFLPTAELRSSVVVRAKDLNYKVGVPIAATTTVEFTLASTHNLEILIPKNLVLTIDSKPFTVTNDLVIPINSLKAQAIVKQGQAGTKRFTSSGASWIRTGIGQNASNVIVTVGDIVWSVTDSFIQAVDPTSYRLYEDKSGWVVLFGGGINTLIPPEGALITIEFITTLGEKGNVSIISTPAEINGAVFDVDGNTVTELISAEIISPATGGRSVESNASIKINAPATYATQNRAVIEEDYAAIARTVSGVEGARAWGGEKVNQYGYVFVAIYGNNPGEVPQSLLDAVLATLNKISTSPIIVKVVPPILVTVDITTVAYLKDLSNLTVIRNQISQSQSEFVRTLTIGDGIQTSNIQSILSDIDGISHVNVFFFTRKTEIVRARQFNIPVIQFPDETTFKVFREEDNEQIWQYGQTTYSLIEGSFGLNTNMSDGTLLRLECASLHPDIYPQRSQLLVIGSQNITTKLAGSP